MAYKIMVGLPTGLTDYILIFDSQGNVWDASGSSFVVYNEPDYGTKYAVAMAEIGTSGIYQVSFPTAITTPDIYNIFVKRRVGAVAALPGDAVDAQGDLPWNGAKITSVADIQTIKGNPVVNGGTVTFPTNATLASTTNITAGTITTTTNLTNLPAITANWLTAAGIANDAITAAKIADGAIDTATFAAGTTIPRCTLVDTVTTLTNLPAITANWLTAAGIAAGALNGKGDWLLASSYTAPPSVASIFAGVFDTASTIEGLTFRQAFTIAAADAAGTSSGNESNAPVIKGMGAATTRITGVTDANGNRISVTLNPP